MAVPFKYCFYLYIIIVKRVVLIVVDALYKSPLLSCVIIQENCSYSWSQETISLEISQHSNTWSASLSVSEMENVYIYGTLSLFTLKKKRKKRKKESAKHDTLSHNEIWNVQILWRRYEFCQTKGFWRVICSFNASVQRFKVQTRAVVSVSTNGMIPRNRERQLQRFETIHLKGRVSRSGRSRWTTFWPVVCLSK